ncbi:MAG: hypothetical protein H2045_09205 [Rhizobiales bacterium]|nr:hypothetical protein [Hyphomicrobiales bacterium]
MNRHDDHFLSATLLKLSSEFSLFSENDQSLMPDAIRSYATLFETLARLAFAIEKGAFLLDILADQPRVMEILNRHISPEMAEDLAEDLLSEKGTMQ